MSTDADRTHSPDPSSQPPPESFPRRPQVPPRPAFPPRPSAPPRAGAPVEPPEKDEPTPPMPHDTEPDASGPAEPTSSSAPESASARFGGPRAPLSASAPQPPPPTGRPLAPGTTRSGPYGIDGRNGKEAGDRTGPSGGTGTRGGLGLDPSGFGLDSGRGPGPGALPSQRVPAPPETPPDHFRDGAHPEQEPPTGHLRPVGEQPAHNRPAPRVVAAAACLVLGVGLLGGAAAGTWLTDSGGQAAAEGSFDDMRAAWHNNAVDELFPRVLEGRGAGPGGADRRWLRVAVAPDSSCRGAFDPLLAKALSPVGCSRLVRATYADETTSNVTTVGLVFTRAEGAGMRALRKRFAVENLSERTDLMPRPYASRGTVAADFGDAQRASWTIRVLSDAPVVVYTVSGFADGRVVSDPQPASEATEKGETSAAAQAGLGHDAQGIADRIERRLREAEEAEDE